MEIEKRVERVEEKLNKHISESERIRAMVERHDRKLTNGWAKELTDKLSELTVRFERLEVKLSSKASAWKDIAFGITLVSTLLGVIYTITRLGG